MPPMAPRHHHPPAAAESARAHIRTRAPARSCAREVAAAEGGVDWAIMGARGGSVTAEHAMAPGGTAPSGACASLPRAAFFA